MFRTSAITLTRHTTPLLRTAPKSCLLAAKCSSPATVLLLRPMGFMQTTREFHFSRIAQYARRRGARTEKREPLEEERVQAPVRVETTEGENVPVESDGKPSFYKRLYAKGMLSEMSEPPKMSATERLWRPFLFTILTISGAMYYGYTYKSPTQQERWFPTVPQSFATVASIIAVNTAVFLAWRTPLPLTWRILNRYFISVPALPYSGSILGAVFSHQTFSHLAMNSIALYIFGTTVCEQLGPGWFLALYISGGAASSFGSLAFHVLRKNFATTSLGASGAIAALMGTYCVVNPEKELMFVLLPFLVLKAKYFAMGMAALETTGILCGWRVFDHVAHLGGLAWGTAFAVWLKKEMERRRQEKRRKLLSAGFR